MPRQLCSLGLLVSVTSVALIGLLETAEASDGPCDQCGCQTGCQVVCRLVREKKKVEITCWSCKDEEFCVLGPSARGCKHSDVACDACKGNREQGAPHVAPKSFVWSDWMPGSAKIHTRTRLLKKTTTKEIPSYKWVVEHLCEKCQATPRPPEISATAERVDVASPPMIRAKKLPVPESSTR